MSQYDDAAGAGGGSGAHRHPDAEPVWARESFTDYAEWDEPAGPAAQGWAGRPAAGAEEAWDDEPEEAWDDEPEEVSAPPLADEMVRLLGGVQDWARRTFTEAATATHTGPECQWCPLCQFLAVLKGDRPDVTQRVAEAGTAMMSALRAVMDAAAAGGAQAPPSGRHAHPGPAAGGGSGRPRDPGAPRVQKIDLGDPS